MKRVEFWLLAIGWIGAIVFPLVGLIVGIYISAAKTTTGDRARVNKYDPGSRWNGIAMIAVSVLVILLGIVIQYRRR